MVKFCSRGRRPRVRPREGHRSLEPALCPAAWIAPDSRHTGDHMVKERAIGWTWAGKRQL